MARNEENGELLPELSDAVQQCLKDRGILDKLTATVRAEVIKALKEPEASELDSPRNPLSSDNFLVNELIIEYLTWNGHVNAADVLLAESGQPRLRLSRGELEAQMKVNCGANAQKVPLLYSILSQIRNKK